MPKSTTTFKQKLEAIRFHEATAKRLREKLNADVETRLQALFDESDSGNGQLALDDFGLPPLRPQVVDTED